MGKNQAVLTLVTSMAFEFDLAITNIKDTNMLLFVGDGGACFEVVVSSLVVLVVEVFETFVVVIVVSDDVDV